MAQMPRRRILVLQLLTLKYRITSYNVCYTKLLRENGAIQFEIKAKVELRTDRFIRSGYSANADIELERRDSVMAIREGLITFSNDSAFVEVLTGDSTTIPQIFKKQSVELGLSDGLNIEIKSGIDMAAKLKGNAIVNEKGKKHNM